MSARNGRRGINTPDNGGGDWIWGNNRGGCGAPLKDVNGDTITNLKQVVKERNSPQKNQSPEMRRLSKREQFRARMEEQDDDDYYDEPPPKFVQQPANIPGLISPKKFMGALSEMNANQQEKEMKMAKERQYKDLLRRQIEENRIKKEAEKKQLEDQKKRELEEAMMAAGQITKPRSNRNRNDQNPTQYTPKSTDLPPKGGQNYPRGERENYSDDDLDHNNRRQQQRRRADYDDDDEYNNYNGSPTKQRKPRGNNRRTSFEDEGGGHSDRSEVEVEKRNRRGGLEGQNKNGQVRRTSKDSFVSAVEYDELSSLCDRLLQQQDQLQSEIQKQSEIIKELQKRTGIQVDNGGNSKPRRRVNSIPEDDVDYDEEEYQEPVSNRQRSKSVQQPRLMTDPNDVPLNGGRNKNSYQGNEGKGPNSKGRNGGGIPGLEGIEEKNLERIGRKIQHQQSDSPTTQRSASPLSQMHRPNSMYEKGSQKIHPRDEEVEVRGNVGRNVKNRELNNRGKNAQNGGNVSKVAAAKKVASKVAFGGAADQHKLKPIIPVGKKGPNGKGRGSDSGSVGNKSPREVGRVRRNSVEDRGAMKNKNKAQAAGANVIGGAKKQGLKLGGNGGSPVREMRANNNRLRSRDDQETQPVGNGFAKLQSTFSKQRSNPVVVVHEDEGTGGRGMSGSLELQGESAYIKVQGDDDAISADQLDKLLRQARHSRFQN